MERINKQKIHFRADGNTAIGLGHITRSLALAAMLKDNFEIVFLVQKPSEAVKNQILEVTDQIIILTETADYITEANFIAKNYLEGTEIVVLDGYYFQTEYQQIIKNKGCKLVCIDDLHAWHFVADVVINHGISPEKRDFYQIAPYTKLCLGTDYALLRKPFLEAAKQKISRTDFSLFKNVFICFGGSDSHNLTLKALKSCLKIDFITKINIVIGSAYLYVQELQNFILNHSEKEIALHQNISAVEIVKVIQNSDLAIVPASGVAHEAASVGMACIGGYYVDNQIETFDFFKEIGIVFGIGNYLEKTETDLKNMILNLGQDKIYEQLTKQKNYFSGQSEANLVKIFQKLALETQLTIRKANIDDMMLYYEWANDPQTRANSLQSENIDLQTHSKWFKQRIADICTFMFVFELGKKAIGQVRFSKINDKMIINYSIDKQFRNKGLGEIVIKKAIEIMLHYTYFSSLEAIVKPTNIASAKVFENLSFELVEQNDSFFTYQKFLLAKAKTCKL